MTRPMPEGFPADAFEMAVDELKRKYRAGDTAVRRWRNEVGLPASRQVQIPDDFVEVAPRHTRRELKRIYGVGSDRLASWLRQTGASSLNANTVRPLRPVPDDFAEVAPTMARYRLRDHYSTDIGIIDRWLAETGLKPGRALPAQRIRHIGMTFRPRTTLASDNRQYGVHDQAADLLRKYYPVYRCDERGRANPKGKLWRAGNSLIDGDELLARADRKRRAA